MITAVPQPLPGKPQPVRNPGADWAKQDLVQAKVEYSRNGQAEDPVYTYQAMGFKGVGEDDGLALLGPTDATAFERLNASSFGDAVEAASQLAVAHPINLNFDHKDPQEKTAASAVALLQAQDGAWYATGLYSRSGAALTVDIGRSNFAISEVEALHSDVKAVVGGHSWVNFTDEDIAPTLAG